MKIWIRNGISILLSRIIFYAYRFYGLTFRYTITDRINLDKALKSHPKGLYVMALWHKNLFSSILCHINIPHVTMASRSKDGAIIAGVLKHMGYWPARGSSSRGGQAALQEMIKLMLRSKSPLPAALTVDGPRGPSMTCKKGVVELAKICQCSIVPCAAIPKKAWRFKSWDHFILPFPFTHVHLFYAEPIDVNINLDKTPLEQIEYYRMQVEESLMKLEAVAQPFIRNYNKDPQ